MSGVIGVPFSNIPKYPGDGRHYWLVSLMFRVPVPSGRNRSVVATHDNLVAGMGPLCAYCAYEYFDHDGAPQPLAECPGHV